MKRSSFQARAISKAVVAMMAASAFLLAETPDPKVLERLGSDSYPERVSAEKDLQRWAEEKGAPARDWLLERYRKADDPEVKRRILAALRGVVVKELTLKRPGYVGIRMRSLKLDDGNGGERFGIEILEINPGTPAEKVGLQAMDVIVSLDGKGWKKAEPRAEHEFGGRIERKRAGDRIQLEVLRAGKPLEVRLELAPRPWSAGIYSKNLRLVPGDPFAGRVPGEMNEDRAADEAFREWMEKQEE